MILHRSTIKSKRVDYLLLTNIYIALFLISCFIMDMCIYYIYGYAHPGSSYDSWWCRIKGYILYICGYTFFHSFSLQAMYRICRIIYPLQTKRQSFRFYIIVSFGQWIFAALELLPNLLIGDIEYLHNHFHWQIAPTNMRGSLTACLLGFLFPFTVIVCCYVCTIHHVRKRSSVFLTIKQRTSMRRDMIILRRVVILLTVLTTTAIPHAFFPVAYRILGDLPTWLVSLEWTLTILALVCISVVIPFVSPHLKKLRTQMDSHRPIPLRTK